MSGKPVVNLSIPYLGPLGTVLAPGNFIRIVGTVSSVGREFFCALQCGPSNYDDVALHISEKLNEGTIVTKAVEFGHSKEENIFENSPITKGNEFEILIICELTVFKIGVNGQHLCEFPHKVPYHRISYLRIEGDLSVSQLSVESQPSAPPTVDQSAKMSSPPPPYGATTSPYPPMGSQPVPPQSVPPQASYPLNSGQPHQTVVGYSPQTVGYAPQPVGYAVQQPPPGVYAYNALPQTNPSIAALNATAQPYRRPFFSRPYYGGNRKMVYIAFAAFGVFTLISLTVFLIVFFKGQSDFEEARERQRKMFNDHW